MAFLHNFRSLKNWKSTAGLAVQQPQHHPTPGTTEAAGDQAAHSASGTRRLTPCLSGPPPPKVSPRYHYGKEHGAEGGKFAPFGRPTTWDTTAGQKRKSQWSSGCLNHNNRSCGDPGLHPHIVKPRFPAVTSPLPSQAEHTLYRPYGRPMNPLMTIFRNIQAWLERADHLNRAGTTWKTSPPYRWHRLLHWHSSSLLGSITPSLAETHHGPSYGAWRQFSLVSCPRIPNTSTQLFRSCICFIHSATKALASNTDTNSTSGTGKTSFLHK